MYKDILWNVTFVLWVFIEMIWMTNATGIRTMSEVDLPLFLNDNLNSIITFDSEKYY